MQIIKTFGIVKSFGIPPYEFTILFDLSRIHLFLYVTCLIVHFIFDKIHCFCLEKASYSKGVCFHSAPFRHISVPCSDKHPHFFCLMYIPGQKLFKRISVENVANINLNGKRRSPHEEQLFFLHKFNGPKRPRHRNCREREL